eukprot:3933996-Rhodomonas_salina.1
MPSSSSSWSVASARQSTSTRSASSSGSMCCSFARPSTSSSCPRARPASARRKTARRATARAAVTHTTHTNGLGQPSHTHTQCHSVSGNTRHRRDVRAEADAQKG